MRTMRKRWWQRNNRRKIKIMKKKKTKTNRTCKIKQGIKIGKNKKVTNENKNEQENTTSTPTPQKKYSLFTPKKKEGKKKNERKNEKKKGNWGIFTYFSTVPSLVPLLPWRQKLGEREISKIPLWKLQQVWQTSRCEVHEQLHRYWNTMNFDCIICGGKSTVGGGWAVGSSHVATEMGVRKGKECEDRPWMLCRPPTAGGRQPGRGRVCGVCVG